MKLLKKLFLFAMSAFLLLSCASASVKDEKSAGDDGKMTAGEISYISTPDARHLFLNESAEDDAVLRKISAPALMKSEGYDVLEQFMMETLIKEKGVGIAAPQVGINRRVIIVQRLDKENQPFEFYYNIVIKEKRGEKVAGWEGCLSIPAGFGKVERWQDIDIEYDAEADGKIVRKNENIKGFTAVIFQHETDHLDGILFIDKKTADPLMDKDSYREMRLKEKAEKEAEKGKEE